MKSRDQLKNYRENIYKKRGTGKVFHSNEELIKPRFEVGTAVIAETSLRFVKQLHKHHSQIYINTKY